MRNGSLLPGIFSALLLLLALTACGLGGGGGGGGGEFIGAAEIALSATPKTVDTGDYLEARVYLSQVNPLGIILKVRYPTALRFVRDSAELTADGKTRILTPDVSTTKDTSSYLVFFLSSTMIPEGAEGEIVLRLKASQALESGKLEVDADIDDPNVANSEEFKVHDPKFAAEDEVSIKVLG